MNRGLLNGTVGTSAIAVWAVLVAAPAVAQNSPNGAAAGEASQDATSAVSEERLPEIIVTAQKRDERLQDVPMAISALSGDSLRAIGAANFEDFARTVPGIDFSNLGPGQNRVTIRGISTFSGASVVGIYLDESPVASPINFTQPSLALYDLNRVEVLRGPQGTLYGENSLGGTLRYITNDPRLDRSSATIDGMLSATDRGGTNYDASAMVNLPLVDDKVAVRLVAGSRHESGFIDNVTLGARDVNDVTTNLVRGKLLIAPGDRLSLKFSALYQDIDQDGASVESLDLPRKSFQQKNEAPEFFQDRIQQYSAIVNYELGFADLQSASSYFVRNTDQAAVSRGFFAQGIQPFPTVSDTDTDYKIFSEEVRLSSATDGPLKWLLGGYYKDLRLDSLSVTTRIDPAQTPVGSILQDQHFQQLAAFGELEYAILPRLSVTAGLRWFHETDRETDVNANSYKVSSDGIIPRFVVNYRHDAGLIYASVSKGFRSAGVNRFPIPGVDVTFKPDTTWNYEIGTKLELFDRQLVLNLAGYWIDWNDLQTFVARPELGPLVFFVQNAATARVKGIEWEAQYAPDWAEGFTIGTAGNYTDARFTSDTPFEGKEGNMLPKVPHWKYSAFVQYETPVGDDLSARARVDYEHTGQFPELGDNILKSGDYTLINARIGLDAEQWSAEIFADNLTNEVADLFQRIPTEYGVYRNRPRTIGVKLGYRY